MAEYFARLTLYSETNHTPRHCEELSRRRNDEAIQSKPSAFKNVQKFLLDCFVAYAPRNDEN